MRSTRSSTWPRSLLDELTEYPLQKGDLKVTAACRTPLLDALGLTEERRGPGLRLPPADQGGVGCRLPGRHLRGRHRWTDRR